MRVDKQGPKLQYSCCSIASCDSKAELNPKTRVTSPKGAKTNIFFVFLRFFRVPPHPFKDFSTFFEGPGPGPGDRARAWGLRRRMKNGFFQMGFQAVNQRPIADYLLQPISRPCSIEKSISSRIAIPASLMRVDKGRDAVKDIWQVV